MIGSKLRNYLKKYSFYYRIKYSKVFHLYEFLFKNKIIKAHKKEVHLYKNFLKNCSLVFDIGAYDGHKTAAFLELNDRVRVISCEPDKQSFKILSLRFKNRNVQLYNIALSNNVGVSQFYINNNGSAFNTLNQNWVKILENDNANRWTEKISFEEQNSLEVKCTTLDALIEKEGIPDFIKIDVEGYERFVIEGLNQVIECISIECLIPEFKEDMLFIMCKIQDLNKECEYNVVYQEELIFNQFVNYENYLNWLDNTTLYTFDLIIRKKSNNAAN